MTDRHYEIKPLKKYIKEKEFDYICIKNSANKFLYVKIKPDGEFIGYVVFCKILFFEKNIYEEIFYTDERYVSDYLECLSLQEANERFK